MASQELSEWRDQESKHQLELIKKSEIDLLAASKTYVLKTHKGEEVNYKYPFLKLYKQRTFMSVIYESVNFCCISGYGNEAVSFNRVGSKYGS